MLELPFLPVTKVCDMFTDIQPFDAFLVRQSHFSVVHSTETPVLSMRRSPLV